MRLYPNCNRKQKAVATRKSLTGMGRVKDDEVKTEFIVVEISGGGTKDTYLYGFYSQIVGCIHCHKDDV
jgi:hypothetical protein